VSAGQFKHGWPEVPAEHVVAVLGASRKPARYSNQAVRLLKAGGYRVIPIHPRIAEIEGVAVSPRLCMISDKVHTLTLYVGPERSRGMIQEIVDLNPARVIFNPGTESAELEDKLRSHHIECIHGCTLVMLRTGQF
jgi:predicted CoA-binding protein